MHSEAVRSESILAPEKPSAWTMWAPASTKQLKSVMVEPPCTTFSVARHPKLRSKRLPEGFDPADPATALGTFLAKRCLTILWVAWRMRVPGLLEAPKTACSSI